MWRKRREIQMQRKLKRANCVAAGIVLQQQRKVDMS
jgi:hypothetical protein